MRPASILLALVVLLSFVSEAGAYASVSVDHDYSFRLAGYQFGFTDGFLHGSTYTRPYRWLHLGPLGFRNVGFSATQGLVGCCVIVVGLVALATALTVRWKRKTSAEAAT
jgi:hypothetical protein